MAGPSNGKSQAFRPRTVALMAAEPSGDLQAGALARALRERDPSLRLVGVGGTAMKEAGVELWMESHLWSTIGPFEALGRLPALYLAYRRMRHELLKARPEITLVVDCPAIFMRLVGFLRRRGLRTAYYFPPSAWTRNPRRLQEIHDRTDAVIATFGRNAELYEQAGLPVAWFGHPLVDVMARAPSPAEARRQLGLEGECVTLMPGSRTQEVRLLLPIFLEVAGRLRRDRPDLQFLLPCATPPLERRIRRMLGEPPDWLHVLSGGARPAMAASRLVLMASGSASLEAALLGVPMVLCYRFGVFDAWLGKVLMKLGLLKIDWFGLPNLVLQESVMPELLQEEANADRLEQEARRLLDEGPARERMLADLARVRQALGPPGVVGRVAALVDTLASGHGMERALELVEAR